MKQIFIVLLLFICILTNSQVCKVWPLGVCTSLSNSDLIKNAGFSFIEENVANTLYPSLSDIEFEKIINQNKNKILKIEALNGIYPAKMKLIGQNVNIDSIVHYSEIVFKRAQTLGIHTLILSSGQARSIPQGMNYLIAKKQFVITLKKIMELAQKYNIIICLEPLNKYETNFITNIPEALEIIKEINNSNLKLCIGYYHLKKENESLNNILSTSNYLYYIHLAEMPMRTAPGFNGEDFTPFFDVLRKINYNGKISIECGWRNLPLQINEAYTQLDKQMCEGYMP